MLAASHRDLALQVKTGVFRQDLYYRIKVMKLELPPLRRRREDIPLLIQHFLESFNALQNKRVIGVSPDVLGVLSAHDYPGNVRELQNIIEHAFMLISEDRIELEHLPSDLVPFAPAEPEGRKLSETLRARSFERWSSSGSIYLIRMGALTMVRSDRRRLRLTSWACRRGQGLPFELLEGFRAPKNSLAARR